MDMDQTTFPTPGKNTSNQGEKVILLHGMGRTRASLSVLQFCLKWSGYDVYNFPYGTTFQELDDISRRLIDYIDENVETRKYHFIAHSLGNIIIRNGFKFGFPPEMGRIVMLAPPNRPSHLAQSLKDNFLYRWINGDSGQKLACEDFYRDLPVPSVEFGVIAGGKGQYLTFDQPNDGIVKVENTRLDGMKDWVLVNHTHTFLMNSKTTISHCLHFLENGEFHREEGGEVD